MGFTRPNGEFADTEDVTLYEATLQATGTAYGDWLEVGDRTVARLLLDVSDSEGTITVDVTLQTRYDSSDTARDIDSFTQLTSETSERLCFAGLDREIRIKSVVAGSDTPKATLTVSGELA